MPAYIPSLVTLEDQRFDVASTMNCVVTYPSGHAGHRAQITSRSRELWLGTAEEVSDLGSVSKLFHPEFIIRLRLLAKQILPQREG